jgi:hypothetical protein
MNRARRILSSGLRVDPAPKHRSARSDSTILILAWASVLASSGMVVSKRLSTVGRQGLEDRDGSERAVDGRLDFIHRKAASLGTTNTLFRYFQASRRPFDSKRTFISKFWSGEKRLKGPTWRATS